MALDEPRFLERRAGRNLASNPALAMRGDGEPVDDETLQRFSAEARRRFEVERAYELARRENSRAEWSCDAAARTRP